MDNRGRIQDAIEHDGQLAADVLLGDLAEELGALVVHLETDHGGTGHRVTVGHGAGDIGAGQPPLRLAFDHVRLQARAAVGLAALLLEDLVTGLDHAGVQLLAAVGVDQAEFQEGGLLDVGHGALFVLLRQAGQLDEDPVVARGLDDGLGHAELVHAATQDLDGLREGPFLLELGHQVVGVGDQGIGLHGHQEGGAALQIQAQAHLAGPFTLQAVEDVAGGLALFGGLRQRKVAGDVVGANGLQQIGKLPVRVGLLQLSQPGQNALEGVVALGGRDPQLKLLRQVLAGHRQEVVNRPDQDEDDRRGP